MVLIYNPIHHFALVMCESVLAATLFLHHWFPVIFSHAVVFLKASPSALFFFFFFYELVKCSDLNTKLGLNSLTCPTKMYPEEENKFSCSQTWYPAVRCASRCAVSVMRQCGHRKGDESGRWEKVGCDACGTRSGDSSNRQLLLLRLLQQHSPYGFSRHCV